MRINTIMNAMMKGKQLNVIYTNLEGHMSIRNISPLVYGFTTKGNIAFRVYDSKYKEYILMLVSGISNITETDLDYPISATKGNFSSDKGMSKIINYYKPLASSLGKMYNLSKGRKGKIGLKSVLGR